MVGATSRDCVEIKCLTKTRIYVRVTWARNYIQFHHHPFERMGAYYELTPRMCVYVCLCTCDFQALIGELEEW